MQPPGMDKNLVASAYQNICNNHSKMCNDPTIAKHRKNIRLGECIALKGQACFRYTQS